MADEPIPDQSQTTLPLATDAAAGPPAEAGTAPASTAPATEPPVSEAPPVTAPKFLGRFHTAEQLEAYAQGLEQAQRQPRPASPPSSAPSPAVTVDQLKFSKNHWRTEAFKAQAAGDEAAYRQATSNLDWCDEQLYETRLSQESKKWQGQSAAQSLMQEGLELLKPYQADLVPGNPLYETAQTYFAQAKQALEAGASIDNILSGLTVLAAAQKTGKSTAGIKQQATAEFATALNKAAKQAVVTGGGAATKTASGKPDYAAMSDAEFAKAEAAILEQAKSVPWSRHQLT